MGLKKVQKQGRDERTQEDYPTSAVQFLQMSGSLLAFFHLCLVSALFSGPSLNEMKFHKTFFPSLCCISMHKTNATHCRKIVLKQKTEAKKMQMITFG